MSDIDKLLLEAAEENYDDDNFDDENDNKNSSKLSEKDKSEILRNIIQKVHHEEESEHEEAKKLLKEEGKKLKPQPPMAQKADRFKRNHDGDDDDENLLLEAADEVHQKHKGISIKEEHKLNNDDDDDDDDDDDGNDNDPKVKTLNTQLLVACYRGDINKANTLLKSGANIKARYLSTTTTTTIIIINPILLHLSLHLFRDRHNWTPLMWASSKGFHELVEDLLSKIDNKKKYINAHDSLSGFTALHLAVIGQHEKTIKILINNGADKNKSNKVMETPIDCLPQSSKKMKQIYDIFGIAMIDDSDSAPSKKDSDIYDSKDEK